MGEQEKPAPNPFWRTIRKMFFAMNVVCFIPVILTALAPIISPTVNWLPAFFSLWVEYIVLIPILWIIGWMIFVKWKVTVLNLLILTSLIPQMKHFFRWGGALKGSANDFTVISYNMDACDYKFKNLQPIVQALQLHKPDIVILQEYFDMKNPKYSREILSKELNLPYTAYCELMQDYGLFILSKFPILDSGAVTSTKNRPQNGIQFADIKLFGETLRIYNAHLESYNFALDQRRAIESTENQEHISFRLGWDITKRMSSTWKKQMEQAQLLNYHRDSSLTTSTIVAGDLNNPPYNYIYHKVRGELQDAFLERGVGRSPTYSNAIGAFRIDYVLPSNNLTVVDYQTITSGTTEHQGVLTKLRFKK